MSDLQAFAFVAALVSIAHAIRGNDLYSALYSLAAMSALVYAAYRSSRSES